MSTAFVDVALDCVRAETWIIFSAEVAQSGRRPPTALSSLHRVISLVCILCGPRRCRQVSIGPTERYPRQASERAHNKWLIGVLCTFGQCLIIKIILHEYCTVYCPHYYWIFVEPSWYRNEHRSAITFGGFVPVRTLHLLFLWTYVLNFWFSCRLLIPVIKFCIIIICMMLMTVTGAYTLWLV